MSSKVLQARLAAESRHRPSDDHTQLRQEFKAARLEETIRETVDSWPPLTPEQRDRLALLLQGGAS